MYILILLQKDWVFLGIPRNPAGSAPAAEPASKCTYGERGEHWLASSRGSKGALGDSALFAVFVWLWLMAGANLLSDNNTADWMVAGGWC